MRLSPELVPRPLWWRSAYRLLARREWEAIRRDVLDEAGSACVACGEKPEKGLTCHEQWRYDDDDHVATLVGFECVCGRCSLAHHIGLASAIGPEAESGARERLAVINGISEVEVDRLLKDAFAVWRRRSMADWGQRVHPDLASRYPALAVLDSAVTEARPEQVDEAE